VTAFVFYAVLMASSGATVSELWGEIQRAAAAADRLGEVLAIPPAIAAPAKPLPLPPAQGRVVFEAVTLRYPTRPDSPFMTQARGAFCWMGLRSRGLTRARCVPGLVWCRRSR